MGANIAVVQKDRIPDVRLTEQNIEARLHLGHSACGYVYIYDELKMLSEDTRLTEKERNEFKEILDFWWNEATRCKYNRKLTGKIRKNLGRSTGFDLRYANGFMRVCCISLDYDTLLRLGISGMRDRIKERMEEIPEVDLFLYDLKETDPVNHKEYTSVDNNRILENLRKLDADGGAIILRCPIVPDLNDRNDHFEKLAAVANTLKNLKEIDIMPFHPYGEYKNRQIGETYSLSNITAVEDKIALSWIEKIGLMVAVPVKKG